MRNKTIIIMAGGTGGHVYPALAIADNLKARGYNLLWLGTSKGLEVSVTSRHDYPLLKINVAGIRGKGISRLAFTPFMLARALLQTLIIMMRVRPAAVIGMGGFVSGPGGIAAWLTRRPLLIHEQNAIAGFTNRLLAPFAVSIMTGFPGVFKKSGKLTVTGNPVRTDIINIPKPQQRFHQRTAQPLKILIFGGSIGAKRLNEVIPQTLATLREELQFEIRHQSGQQHLSATEKTYRGLRLQAEVIPFINDMAGAYTWADLIICRAGALTVAELSSCGTASILIPFPYAVDDHQTENAQYLVKAGAAVLIQETQLSIGKLRKVLLRLCRSPEQLLQMAVRARDLAKPEATEIIAKLCMEAAHV